MDSTAQTKRERRLAARAERQRMAEAGRRRAQTRRRASLIGLVVAALAVLAVGGWLLSQSLTRPMPGRTVPDEGRDHVNQGTPLTYRSNPPASGTHYPTWTRPGFYAEAQEPGNWVHSLEHGYIVLLYNCPSGCPDLVQQLRQFYEAAPKSSKYGYQKVVITPYQNMDHQLAAVAWTHIDELDAFDQDRLMTFYKAYLDRGP
jgi:hypothetical protein